MVLLRLATTTRARGRGTGRGCARRCWRSALLWPTTGAVGPARGRGGGGARLRGDARGYGWTASSRRGMLGWHGDGAALGGPLRLGSPCVPVPSWARSGLELGCSGRSICRQFADGDGGGVFGRRSPRWGHHLRAPPTSVWVSGRKPRPAPGRATAAPLAL